MAQSPRSMHPLAGPPWPSCRTGPNVGRSPGSPAPPDTCPPDSPMTDSEPARGHPQFAAPFTDATRQRCTSRTLAQLVAPTFPTRAGQPGRGCTLPSGSRRSGAGRSKDQSDALSLATSPRSTLHFHWAHGLCMGQRHHGVRHVRLEHARHPVPDQLLQDPVQHIGRRRLLALSVYLVLGADRSATRCAPSHREVLAYGTKSILQGRQLYDRNDHRVRVIEDDRRQVILDRFENPNPLWRGDFPTDLVPEMGDEGPRGIPVTQTSTLFVIHRVRPLPPTWIRFARRSVPCFVSSLRATAAKILLAMVALPMRSFVETRWFLSIPDDLSVA